MSSTSRVTVRPAAGARTSLDVLDCCSPVNAHQVIDAAEAEVLAARFKALADPTRVRLVSLVAAHEGGEACVCDLVEPVGLSQPTVSHHLKILVDAGILTREQRGRWAYYALRRDTLDRLAASITTGPAR